MRDCLLRVVLRQRDFDHDEGANAAVAVDAEVTAEQRHALVHTRKPYPLAGTIRVDERGRIESLAPVSYPKTHPPPQALEHYPYTIRARVPAGVGQGLLRDAEERRLDCDGKQPVVAHVRFEFDAETLRSQLLYLQAYRSLEPEVVERRRPEMGDHPPCLPDRPLYEA